MTIQDNYTGEITDVEVLRLFTDGKLSVKERDHVAIEKPVTIAIDGIGEYTIMCTPVNLTSLAVGFVFSEGLVSGMQDIRLIRCCEDDPFVVRVQLDQVPETASPRSLIMTSSCGMCGSTHIEETLALLPKCPDRLQVSLSTILEVMGKMKSLQRVFRQTGGTHAVAVFTQDGQIAAFAEDIGRHNAFDKAVGHCLLNDMPVDRCGAALSGRVSFELVAKAARAGIELIAAVSAPTLLAIEATKKCNITLCGFVRDDRATVYCHESRVIV